MSKAVSFRSTKRASKNPVAAIVLVADEDFLAADRGAGDVETTSCPTSTVSICAPYFRAGAMPTTESICTGERCECKSCRRYKQHEQTGALCACISAPGQNVG